MVFVRIGELGLVASVVLAACFTKPDRPDGSEPSADGWLDGFAFRKRIEVQLGASEPLASFPVGIARTDPDLAAHADDQGRDIVATAGDGTTMLSSELAAYDAGAVELWVRIPELVDGTAFYVYYGGDTQVPSTTTWDAPFHGVWHLSEPGDARDSTSFTNHMSSTGSRVPASVPGVFGGGRSLDGQDDSLSGGDSDSVDFGTGSFSYSMWVFQEANNGEFDTPFYKGGPSAPEPGYCWLLGDIWTAKVHDGAELVDPELGPASMFQGRWVHLVAVVDRAAGRMTAYADGGTISGDGTLDVGDLSNNQPVQLGRADMTAPFTGLVDEVRLYNTALTVDWVRAEYKNGLDPSFLDVGVEEARP